MNSSNDAIGNRTGDLPSCNAVPQRTAGNRVSHNTNVPTANTGNAHP